MDKDIDAVILADLRRLCADGEAARIRERASLSQSEVARTVGTAHSTISRWEGGSRRPRGSAALRYAALLDALKKRQEVSA